MIRFYKLDRRDGEINRIANLDAETRLSLASLCSVNILTIDIRDWAVKANHGDIFNLNQHFTILAFEFDHLSKEPGAVYLPRPDILFLDRSKK